MASGKASVGLIIDLPPSAGEGPPTRVFVECSAAQFGNLAAIVRGACQRWGQEI